MWTICMLFQCSYCFDIWVGPFCQDDFGSQLSKWFCVPCFHWLKICEKTTWNTYTQFMSNKWLKYSKNNFNAWYFCGIHSQMPVRYCEGTTFRSVEPIVQKHLWFQTLALLHDSIVRTYVGNKVLFKKWRHSLVGQEVWHWSAFYKMVVVAKHLILHIYLEKLPSNQALIC